MPLGSRHDETGLLLGRGGELALERDAGGMWRIKASHSANRLVGRRVRVVGTRAEFDLLDVSKIELI